MSNLEFPKGFYWGAATSSHQVEGGNLNQWSKWEKQNAERLAQEAETYWQDWQRQKFPEMFEPANYISGRAADHYHRFKEDFDLAKELGHNAHRFSIEWSRVEPRQGEFNQREIEHYGEVVRALKERGIEPFVTLYHWTYPLWFRDAGGWENEKSPEYFERFAVKMVSALAGVKFWMIINEPMVYVAHGYWDVIWPPQRKKLYKSYQVIKNLKKAHLLSYCSLKAKKPDCQVGTADHAVYFEGNVLAGPADYFWNHYFLASLRNQFDFLGLNYYHHNHIKGLRFNQNENKEITDMGWEIYPRGIYHALKGLKKYNKPIYIMENGLADKEDNKREKFIKDHLFWIHKAIQEDVKVRGYLYWSLLDNFEWDKGFWPRFGLIEVDYKNNCQRKIRPSAYKYAQICKENKLIH